MPRISTANVSARRRGLVPADTRTQVVARGDDTTERAPRIRVHAEPAAQSLGFPTVHHLESERELLPELFLPLPAQRRRSEHQDALDAAAP